MRLHPVVMLTIAAGSVCAASADAAEQRRQPHAGFQVTPASTPRARQHRQVDVNDAPGHGAWRGCAEPNAVGATKARGPLATIYCGRAPAFLALTGGEGADVGGTA